MAINKNPLLLEYNQFNPTILTEQDAKSYGLPGGFIVNGVLQRAGVKNHNGRIYPKFILERECQRYEREFIAEKRALGELDHPESSVVNLHNVSHNILKVWWEGDDLHGMVQVLDTPTGQILKTLFKEGITLGISSRGLGSVKELYKEQAVEVQDDFELIAWDFVSNPSTHGAFMKPTQMTESVNKNNVINKYDNTNKIITSILCDGGKCII